LIDTQLFLSENPLFASLSEKDLHYLHEHGIQRTYHSQEVIVHQGDIWPYLFLVHTGQIDAVKGSMTGRALIATSFSRADVFWGLAFFDDDALMPTTLHASQPTSISIWSRAILEPILKKSGEMSWRLLQLMNQRLQLASGIVEDLAFQPVMARVAGLLLEYFGDAEDDFQARILTLDDMAARIGTTREMVCRHLHQFVGTGAIEMSRTELRITNRAQLEQKSGRG